MINDRVSSTAWTVVALNLSEKVDPEVNYAHQIHESIPHPIIALIFIAFTAASAIANLALLIYIVVHKLYHNFISSHFIAHLCMTNIFCAAFLLPMFHYTLFTGVNIWKDSNYACRIQALLTCTVWTVMALMALCIAGVHLLTFARIHYEQLFGLPPNMLCALSWLISLAMALPAITNGHVVVYDSNTRHCIWGHSDSGLKFLTYLLILGVLIPTLFSSYAYARVLGILYHSPIVFQSIGLYKSRFLVYAFLLSPFYQVPFYVVTNTGVFEAKNSEQESLWPIICMFFAYTNCLVSPFLYGASLFMMKEEDMALTARAHKGAAGAAGGAYHPGSNHPHHNLHLQAQLI